MKLFCYLLIALMSTIVFGKRNYGNDFNDVNGKMTQLSQAIDGLQAVATRLNHRDVITKCSQARSLISGAQTSWRPLFIGFGSVSRGERAAQYNNQVQARLDSCSSALQWIYKQDCVSKNKQQYQPHINNCQTKYQQWRSGCKSVIDSPPSPQPSQAHRRRELSRRNKQEQNICPAGEVSCPLSTFAKGFECLDIKAEISSCGGCMSKGEGENCLTIPGADEVSCQEGSCVVKSLKKGYGKDGSGRPVPL